MCVWFFKHGKVCNLSNLGMNNYYHFYLYILLLRLIVILTLILHLKTSIFYLNKKTEKQLILLSPIEWYGTHNIPSFVWGFVLTSFCCCCCFLATLLTFFKCFFLLSFKIIITKISV